MADRKISGKRINKVLVGFTRNFGSFISKEDNKETEVSYDNVTVFYMDYAASYIVEDDKSNSYSSGFIVRSAKQPVESDKIKVIDFEDIVGIPLEEFTRDFDKKYRFHGVNPRYCYDDFGKMVLCELPVLEDDIFTMLANAEQKTE